MEDKDEHLVFYSPQKGQLILFAVSKQESSISMEVKSFLGIFAVVYSSGHGSLTKVSLSAYFRAAYQ